MSHKWDPCELAGSPSAVAKQTCSRFMVSGRLLLRFLTLILTRNPYRLYSQRSKTKKMNMFQAINDAMRLALERDPSAST